MKPQKLVKTEFHGLSRCSSSSALINTDSNSFRVFKEQREKLIEQQKLKSEVEQLRNELGDIKALLQQLVNGK